MKLLIVLEQIEKIKDKIDKVKIKNPETGRENKLTSALSNKDSAAHEKALQIYKKIKLGFEDKNQDKSNKKYIEQIAKSIKLDSSQANSIKKKLDTSKNRDEFKKIFRKHISDDIKVFDDKFLNMTYEIWNRKEKQEKPQKEKAKSKQDKKIKSKPKVKDYFDNYNDSSYEEKEKNDLDIDKDSKTKLIILGLLFGGITKTFSLSKNMLLKMKDGLSNNLRNEFERFKEI